MARSRFASFALIAFLVCCDQSPQQNARDVATSRKLFVTANLVDDNTIPITITLNNVTHANGTSANGTTLLILYGVPPPEHEVARCIVSGSTCGPVTVIVPKSTFGNYGFALQELGTPRANASVLLIQQVITK